MVTVRAWKAFTEEEMEKWRDVLRSKQASDEEKDRATSVLLRMYAYNVRVERGDFDDE